MVVRMIAIAGALIALVLCAASAALAADRDASPLSIKLQAESWSGDLDGMLKRRYIRVLVPYSKTLYFVDLGGTQRGISYEFMRAFEESLNKGQGNGKLRLHAVFIPVSRENLLPLGLAKGSVLRRNVAIGEPIRYDDLEHLPDSPLARMRREQDRISSAPEFKVPCT